MKDGQFQVHDRARRGGRRVEVVVEEKRAGSFAVLGGEGGEGVIVGVEFENAGEYDVADDVDVVEEKGLIETTGIFEEKPGGFFQAAASVQQNVFAGNLDAHAEAFMGLQVVDDHVSEMMDVDNDFVDAEGAQAGNGNFGKGVAGEVKKSFWASVSELAEAR